MNRTTPRRLPAVLFTGLAAGALGLAAFATPAHAANNGDTSAIMGSPANKIGVSWYDTGAFPAPSPNPGPHRTVTLSAVQQGTAVKVTVSVSRGPNTSALSAVGAGTYRLDALVRLDGAADARGTTRLVGQVGAVAVDPDKPTYTSGTTMVGTINNVSPGAHTITLTDLLMDSTGPNSGNGFGTPTGFDVYYNPGTTSDEIIAGKDWSISQSITVTPDKTKPVVGVTVPKKPTKAKSWKTIKGTATDASGVKSVTVKLTQKRSDGKYFYNGKKWKKGKASKAKAVAAKVSGSSWSASIKKPGKGKLTIKYSGTDKVGNTSKTKTYKTQKLK